jgi:transposase InsO family protein
VERLMRAMGLQGAVRGKTVKTAVLDPTQPRLRDKVNRQLQAPAPNRLWVSDFADVATWRGSVYVASAIDTYARRIVGWRVSGSPTAGLVLDALERAIHDRRLTKGTIVAHSDRGAEYQAVRHTERIVEVGVESSARSVGDSYDNALAETVIGLCKTELIRRRRPWRSLKGTSIFYRFPWLEAGSRAGTRMPRLVGIIFDMIAGRSTSPRVGSAPSA